MRVLPYSDDSIQAAVQILRKGGVIAHATETCYGFACDLSNIDAVRKLFAIKKRSEMQPISGLFSSVDNAKMYVEWNDRAEELATQHLPGPFTMILPLIHGAPLRLFPILTPDAPTIGVRVSSSPFAQALVAAFDSPLTTTSANLHGLPNPYSAQDIESQFAGQELQPDLIIDSGILPENPPSTVMDLTGEAETVRRQGKI